MCLSPKKSFVSARDDPPFFLPSSGWKCNRKVKRYYYSFDTPNEQTDERRRKMERNWRWRQTWICVFGGLCLCLFMDDLILFQLLFRFSRLSLFPLGDVIPWHCCTALNRGAWLWMRESEGKKTCNDDEEFSLLTLVGPNLFCAVCTSLRRTDERKRERRGY